MEVDSLLTSLMYGRGLLTWIDILFNRQRYCNRDL